MKKQQYITLAHGNGGRLMHELVGRLKARFSNAILNEMADAAEMRLGRNRIAFSTDSFVVRPLSFPGGDIGKLAVCGTVNDLSMKGARPFVISLALIIEEGLAIDTFERIADSIAQEASQAHVQIVTGDIKVVEKGAADRIFINTAGIGLIEGKSVGAEARPGDAVIVNGPIAEHGMAVLEARERLGFVSNIKSDCRCLHKEVQRCLSVSKNISVMRDPTRGGVATSLNEVAKASKLGIEIDEKEIPIRKNVGKMCDVLGFDPLYVANEGKFLVFAPAQDALKIKKAIGPQAKIIGRVVRQHLGDVYLRTILGSSRILPMLETDQLPRIC